jgi:hypothetical protein
MIDRAIWGIVKDKVTDIQYRRLEALYGRNEEGKGVREVARAEGVDHAGLVRSRDGALARLAGDWRLWAFWLFGAPSVVTNPYVLEDDATTADKHYVANTGTRTPLRGPDDGVTDDPDARDQWGEVQLYPAGTSWSSDSDGGAPSEMEAYGDGWIAYHEEKSRNPYRKENLRAAWKSGYDDAGNVCPKIYETT